MIILPETMTEKQNKFLLFYAIDGMKTALEKANVKEETVRGWMRCEEFLSLMNSMRDSYLSMASLHLKKSALLLSEKLTDLLLSDKHEINPRDRASLIIKALEMIRNFTMAKDTSDLLRQSEALAGSHTRYEGAEVVFEEVR